jgi:hypothetical protein
MNEEEAEDIRHILNDPPVEFSIAPPVSSKTIQRIESHEPRRPVEEELAALTARHCCTKIPPCMQNITLSQVRRKKARIECF